MTRAGLQRLHKGAIAVALMLSAPLCESVAQVGAPALEVLKERVRAEILLQRKAWQELESSQHPPIDIRYSDSEPTKARVRRAGCSQNPDWFETVGTIPVGQYFRLPGWIPSQSAFLGTCPWWIPPKVAGKLGRTHEYTGYNPTPAQLHPFSDSLIDQLETASLEITDDIWPISQLIRVLTENGDFDRARRALGNCKVDAGWCAMLRLYVEQEDGHYPAADSLARILLRDLAPAESRPLADPSMLLYRDDAITYLGLQDKRELDSLNTNVWWLAQPFFSDSGNARRTEHLSRIVRNTLAQQIDIDPYYNTSPKQGGDAVQLMRQRYGWTTHQAWVGSWEEERVTRLYDYYTPSPPYSAPEYSWPRSATLPILRAARDPLSVTDSDYHLSPPAGVIYFRWWPPEFFRHKDGLILPFSSVQKVQLRRDNSVHVIVATNLTGGSHPTLVDSIGEAPVRGELWFSPRPDSARMISATASHTGERLVLHGDVFSSGIVSAEYRVNANGLAGGRSRFGIREVQSLNALPPGRCDISVPMLVAPESLSEHSAVDLHRALLGSLTFHRPRELGVVWESYGIESDDSTSVTLHVYRDVEPGLLRRAAMSLGVAQDPSTNIAIHWTVSGASLVSQVPSAIRTVTQRQLAVNVQSLKAGEYQLAITMQNSKCGEVTSSQTITITR